MADYIAVARTNYFRVVNLDAFQSALTAHGVTPTGWGQCGDLVLDTDPANTPQGAVALFANGPWPMLGEDMLDPFDEGVACPEYAPSTTHTSPGTGECSRCHHSRADHPTNGVLYESIPDLVAAHLVDGDVAVFLEVGAEKMRYLGGIAYAVNSQGESRTVSLEDIYEQAKPLGDATDAAF